LVLEGMNVLSFCHYLQGPAAMQYLADMGAEVIKVEPPNGAFERHWAGAANARVGGVSAFYLCANRNLRSIAIDLKHPEAAAVIHALVANSHIVAENFRPGTLDRLGFGYEALRAVKPEIIFASASGFGSTGPLARLPGQDLLAQAMSGLAAVGGDGRTPVAAGVTVADQHGAALLALAIVGAYSKLLTTGKGSRVEATLLGSAIDLQVESIVTYHASKAGPESIRRNRHLATWFHDAPYGIYAALDGHVALSINDLNALLDALDTPEARGVSGCDPYRDRDRIAEVVAAAIARKTIAELTAALDEHNLWYARVEDYDSLLHNPQARHNGVFQSVPINGETATLVAHPVRYDGQVPTVRHLALEAGADTRPVLEQAGFCDSEIADLFRNKIVFAPEDTK
jgi:crotonobetainyl-CoA:carnitine CoA-transferase CaiB-like acyl-CoA transferase